MNPFNPKIPMMIKVWNNERMFNRRLREVLERGHVILSQGKHVDNGSTVYWAKIDREDKK